MAYIVFGALWTASYDARVTSGEPKLELNYYGNICNNSGEDWENVCSNSELRNNCIFAHFLLQTSLSLSTAQVSVAGL